MEPAVHIRKTMLVAIHYVSSGNADTDNAIEQTITTDVALMCNEKHEEVYEGTSRFTERRFNP